MRVTVIGVPDSAGAYGVGVERAPAALREAGLIDALEATGRDIVDAGDLTERSWTPDRESPLLQNVDQEILAMRELADAVAAGLDDGRVLVLGGACTVALGVCAALVEREGRARLVYVDRHLDLNTPHSTREGSLSWMGMAHALAVDGAAEGLANATGHAPLLSPADLVYLGHEPMASTEGEREAVEELGLIVVSQEALVEQPADAARAARTALSEGPFAVHLDVDVLDFLDAPIAENVNGRNSGPTIEQLGRALAELWRDPDCRGLSIGQLDPAHARADPSAIPRLVAMLGEVVAAG
ncbi:arginase family protein [Labedella endophytica]|uniref:Arginase n=1 Tax=Labedella endophytica TaxID=1523160 RepID=A0A3S0X9P0_9MICO|nr:arginase family protein [Labedella endophytica]RUR03131.1 arginase [Labedella endophytica]